MKFERTKYDYFSLRQDPKVWSFLRSYFITNAPQLNEVTTRYDMKYGQVWYPTLVDKLINFTKAEPIFDT